MPYIADWEPIADAVRDIVETGLSAVEAQRQLCNAIADRKIRARLILGEDRYRGLPEIQLSVPELPIPPRLSPAQFDWERSAPLGDWPLVTRRLEEPISLHMARVAPLMGRVVSLVEVRTADVRGLFGEPREKERDSSSTVQSRPTGGAKSRGIKEAIAKLWPNGFPAGLTAKERNNRIIDWLRTQGLSVSGDISRTVQRAIKRVGAADKL
jgi:hypothetical protein